ncbi:fibronectin type III domain-containing protein [Parapedobacter soli]|uniref:fibronectin type III domain-containing protein n=1 Tax=Parapedobacter soli TaxID=416955 RepID=UPI0021CAAE3F|nr:fibronectin type III domain-containing protein [Parapedobacter soli]
MKRQVKINYGDYRDADLGYLASTVLQAIGGNTEFFAEPNPPLEELELALADYDEKMQLTNRKGSPYDSEAKNASKKVLVDVLRRLAFYVNTTCNGVTHKLLSSGFRLKDLPKVLTVPTTPTRARLVDGHLSGQLALLFDPVPNATEFEYQVGTMVDREIVWGEIASFRNGRNKRDNIIADLTPAVTYYVRVRARNPQGVSDWSAPASQIAR